jgi:hypothetical protein
MSDMEEPFQTLRHVRDALLVFTYASVIDTAIGDLQRLVQSLYDFQPPIVPQERLTTRLGTLPLTWPVALLLHLEWHRERLLSA